MRISDARFDRPFLARQFPVDYVIDGQNRRIGKKVNGALAEGFLYRSQIQPAAWLDGTSGVKATFIYGLHQNVPEYMVQGGTTYRIITDQVGSVRLVENTSTGTVAERIDYDEFGNVLMYRKLVDQRAAAWQNCAHFYAVAATLMRRILVDNARSRAAAARCGGGLLRADFPAGRAGRRRDRARRRTRGDGGLRLTSSAARRAPFLRGPGSDRSPFSLARGPAIMWPWHRGGDAEPRPLTISPQGVGWRFGRTFVSLGHRNRRAEMARRGAVMVFGSALIAALSVWS